MSVRGSVWLCRVMYAHVCSELLYTSVYGCEKLRTALTPVVPKVNSAIQRITLYPMDNAIGFHNIIRWIVSYQAPVVQKGAGWRYSMDKAVSNGQGNWFPTTVRDSDLSRG